jgi:hypothetical protein
LRGCEVEVEVHRALSVAQDVHVIARVGVFGQPGEWDVDVATIGRGFGIAGTWQTTEDGREFT